MTPEELIAWLFSQPITEEAVRKLDDTQIIAVRGHLSRDYDENGLTGHLLGIVLRDEVLRFEEMATATPAAPAYGETFEFPANQQWDES